MNTVMPSIPTPDVLAAIAPRPTPVRATDASAVGDPARAAANAGRDRDAARGERDFAARLAHEMRAETAENPTVRERRPAPAQGRDARRDRGDDVRTTPEARGDEGRERAVEDAPAGAAETRERRDDAGGDEPPPGGKELPPWLAAELVQARPVPVTTQPPAMLDAEPVALAAGGNASALAFDVAAESAMTGAVTTANAATGAPATAGATTAVIDPDAAAPLAAPLATTAPTVAEPELPVPGAPSANPAAAAGADAATPRALPAVASEVARLLAQARDAERLDTPPADAAKASARALPEAASSPGTPPNVRPAPVALPAAVANAAPTGRSFTLAAAAAAATAPAAASVGAEATVAPAAAPRVELAGPFALALAGASAPATAAPAAVPAQLQLSTPLDAPEWGQQLGERVNWLVSQDLTNAQLKLTPAHLGPIEIRISVADDQANVWFGTHSHVTREALEAAAPKLREMLAAQGYAQVNVGVNVDVSQQAFRERSQTASRYEPGAPLAADEAIAAPAAAPGARAAGPRSRLDAYA